MVGFKFGLKGDKQLQVAMERAYKTAPKVAKKVLQNAAEEGKAVAQMYAPTDTWFLHDHIEAMHNLKGSKIHSKASYSGYVNFGTRYMTAQPYFTDMFNEITKLLVVDMTEVAEGLIR